MNKTYPCEIIKDLLPQYIEHLTHEVSNEAIRDHLNNCPECEKYYALITEPETLSSADITEIDYLKKIKVNNRKQLLLSTTGVAIFIFVVMAWRLFITGSPVSANLVSYETQVTNHTLTFKGTLLSSGQAFSKAVFTKSNGQIEVTLYAVPVSLFKSSGDFNVSFNSDEDIKTVTFDNFITYDREPIDMKTAQLYRSKHAYIGDMSKNMRVAEALGIRSALGPFKNELKTASLPYVWTLQLEQSPEKDPDFQKKMTAYSCAILAVIDNLDEIHWIYSTSLGERTYVLTKENATRLLGSPIKTVSKTPLDLQHFMNQLGLY